MFVVAGLNRISSCAQARKKRGVDSDGTASQTAGAAKRQAVGGSTKAAPKHIIKQQEKQQQQVEMQAVQDLVDRALASAILDEATSDRLLAALYRHDDALLTAWRCNTQQPDARLVKRLLLALPNE